MAPVVMVAVYAVLAESALDGFKVATLPVYVTTDEINAAPCFKVKVAVVIVTGFMASLKVAVIFPFLLTPAARLTGIVELTVGAVVSATKVLFEATREKDEPPFVLNAFTQ